MKAPAFVPLGAVLAALTAAPAAAEPTTAGKEPPAVTEIGDQPIAAGDLHKAYFHFNGETVTVVGHPALFTKRARWSKRLLLAAKPEPKAPALLECKLAEVPEGRVKVDAVLTVRGKIHKPGWGRNFAVPDDRPPMISLEDGCELVSTEGKMPAGGDPWKLGSDPIPVATIHEALFGWQGETVRVVGYYGGTTQSTPGFDESKARTSHGLKAAAKGKGVVHCQQPGKVEAPAAVVAKRENTMVEGKIGEPNAGVAVLEDCQILQ